MYKKIISLDFELYNTKHYWSVCWAGVCLADEKLDLAAKFDVLINPGIKEKFVGPDMKFPFKYKDLVRYDTFGGCADRILGLFSPGTLVLGHAFENDLRMMIDACKKFSLKAPSFDWLDTNVLYNAATGENNEHSLSSLGEKFGVVFSAHDPQEDARATLAVAKGCLGGLSLDEFLAKSGIEVGKLENGVFRKCLAENMTPRQKARIRNFNAVFDAVKRLGQGDGESVFIDNAITSEQNAEKIAEKILMRGGRIAASSYSADRVITNDLSLKSDEKYTSLKSALAELKLPQDGYDFTPNKIRDKENRPISLTEYYKEAYAGYERSGFLSGKSVSFSRAVERRAEFDDFIKAVIGSGGSICPRVDASDIFVVEKKSDINGDLSDGRIKAYRFGRKPDVKEFDAFFALLTE